MPEAPLSLWSPPHPAQGKNQEPVPDVTRYVPSLPFQRCPTLCFTLVVFLSRFHPPFPCLTLSSSFSPSALYPTADARTYLAYLLSYEGALKEAKEELKEAMKQDAEFGNAWNDLGLVGGKGGREGGREGGK